MCLLYFKKCISFGRQLTGTQLLEQSVHCKKTEIILSYGDTYVEDSVFFKKKFLYYILLMNYECLIVVGSQNVWSDSSASYQLED